jgi:hypothetical protein
LKANDKNTQDSDLLVRVVNGFKNYFLNKYFVSFHFNMEIRTEAAQFPEKEYINGIFFAVCFRKTARVPNKKKKVNG